VYCGNCSNCNTEFEETDVSLEAQKIASCVFRLGERRRSFGKNMIIDILRGSKNEKIMRMGLDSLSTWGIMKDENAHRIRTILDFLVDKKILHLEDGEYPVITLGHAGELLKGEQRLFLKMPKERQKPKTQSLHQETVQAQMFTETDEELLDKLKKIRRELARQEGVPAYIVFSDASLLDMCRKKPVSASQFSGVNGVGQVKLEKYGELFTGVIRDHVNA